jgi:hypothetical protein
MTSSTAEKLNKRLGKALQDRNKELAKNLCSQGAHPNCNIGIGEGQFLREAVEKTDIEGVEFLIELGAYPNKVEDVLSIFTRLINAWLNQCHSYLTQLREIYIQFKHGDITQQQCVSRQKKLKNHYEKNEFGIIKLKIAKILVDAGGDINYLMCHPLCSAIRNGLSDFRLILFFILYCNVDWDKVYEYCQEDLKNTVKLWTSIAEIINASGGNDILIRQNDITPLINLTKRNVVNTLKELAFEQYSYVENHEDSYNCTIFRNNTFEFKILCNAYALDISSPEDKEVNKFKFHIQPEDFKYLLGGIWIEKMDIIYLWLGEVRLAYEVLDIEENKEISAYTNQYICKCRNDLHTVVNHLS